MAGVGRNGGGKVMYCFRENILSRRVTEKESKPLRFTLFFLIRTLENTVLRIVLKTNGWNRVRPSRLRSICRTEWTSSKIMAANMNSVPSSSMPGTTTVGRMYPPDRGR